MPRDGVKISDYTGRLLETIDLDLLVNAGSKARNRIIREQLNELGVPRRNQARVKADLENLQIIEAMPNYTIKAPSDLIIYENSTAVDVSTPLSNLIKPAAGTCSLATCTIYRK